MFNLSDASILLIDVHVGDPEPFANSSTLICRTKSTC